MILSYLIDPFGEASKRRKVRVQITTEHSASSYGQPVIVLPDGGALDLMSWVGCGYRVERATPKEQAALATIFATLGLVTQPTLHILRCLRCGHGTIPCPHCGQKGPWYPRTPSRPAVCPCCKSPYYDRPKQIRTAR